jgi:hypothetical protein
MSEPVNPELHRDGWNAPRPVNIPRSTAWPLGTASGITLFAWGFVSSPVLLIVGIVLLAVSLYGWIGEIRND